MLATLLLMAFTAAPPAGLGKVAVLPLVAPSLSPEQRQALATRLLETLRTRGADVIDLTEGGPELGCATPTEVCIGHLAATHGLRSAVQLSVRHSDGQVVTAYRQVEVPSGVELTRLDAALLADGGLDDWLRDNAHRLLTASAPIPEPPTTPADARWTRWIPGMLGAALLVGGGVSYMRSRDAAADLRAIASGGLFRSPTAIDALAARGQTEQLVGVTLLGAGLVGIAASVLWNAFDPPMRRLAIGFDGQSLSVAWWWD